MKKSDITFVTCLFDLGRGNLNDEGFRRPFEHYKNCFARLLQEVHYNLVIYTTPDMNDFIWQYRSQENTRIVNKTLDDLRTFPFYKQVQDIRNTDAWAKQSGWLDQSPQKRLELYSILSFWKQFFTNDCTHFNYFNTKNFLFVDAAISNTIGSPGHYFDEQFEERITPYMNKMNYVCFPYDENAPEVHGFTKTKLNELAGIKTQHVSRGGLFFGNKDSINEINDIYYQLLNSTLNEGYLGTEESIFTIISHKYPNKVNVNMIDGNGLIYKFLEDLKTQPIKKPKEHPLALYFLVFNTPKQFEFTLETWKKAYPKEFKECKKYVVNNSNDPSVNEHYQKLFAENDMEEFKFDNIGINSARQWVAEHFNKTDHDYYIFVEEDMLACSELGLCKNGFATYYGVGTFQKMMEIMDSEDLDFLRLTYTEFFGDCGSSWAYTNFPAWARDKYYPEKEGFVAGKEYSPNLLNKPKVNYIGLHKGIPYAVGNFHYSNWPILFNKRGNKTVFLEVTYEHLYEQVLMSQTGMFWEDGKVKSATLLASLIKHDRFVHYPGEKRRENHHYKN